MSNVLHRTTFQYLKSVNTPDYDPVDWVINPDFSQVQGAPTRHWKIVGDTVTLAPQVERDAADAVALPGIKNGIMTEIDREVEQRIRQGFEWPAASGKFFSLSTNAQIKWTNLLLSKDSLTYPIEVPTMDDKVLYSIADSVEAQNMYGAAVNKIDTLLREATAAKANVNNATTITDAEAARDVYLTG